MSALIALLHLEVGEEGIASFTDTVSAFEEVIESDGDALFTSIDTDGAPYKIVVIVECMDLRMLLEAGYMFGYCVRELEQKPERRYRTMWTEVVIREAEP